MSYTPTKLLRLEYDEKKTNINYPANSSFVTTIPSRVVKEPPDTDGHSDWLVHGSHPGIENAESDLETTPQIPWENLGQFVEVPLERVSTLTSSIV